MLHSAIPRTFLPPPGLCYLGGYYGETLNPYSSLPRFVPLENAAAATYSSLASPHHPEIAGLSRSVSPIPLDLSVKSLPPSSNLDSPEEDSEPIEVDDDRQNDEIWRENHVPEEASIEPLSSPVSRYSQSYDDRSQQEIIITSPEKERIYHLEMPQDCQTQNLGLHFTSPKSLRSLQNYQQQLLLTPQKHQQHQHQPSLQGINAPMTPPSTPSPPQCPRRRGREEEDTSPNFLATPKSSNPEKAPRPKKKHARRLKFDEDTSSPVSGTVILGPDEAVVTGDIDPAFNIVEVTEEARAELAKIENRLGPYQCKLCRQLHDDAFQLAQHRCSRIAHVEYRCPECDKRFSCPANLASHRRWHKPRAPVAGENGGLGGGGGGGGGGSGGGGESIACGKCEAKFSRQAALRKHLVTQHPEINNNNNNNNNNNGSNGNGGSLCAEGGPSQLLKMSLPIGGEHQATELA